MAKFLVGPKDIDLPFHVSTPKGDVPYRFKDGVCEVRDEHVRNVPVGVFNVGAHWLADDMTVDQYHGTVPAVKGDKVK